MPKGPVGHLILSAGKGFASYHSNMLQVQTLCDNSLSSFYYYYFKEKINRFMFLKTLKKAFTDITLLVQDHTKSYIKNNVHCRLAFANLKSSHAEVAERWK